MPIIEIELQVESIQEGDFLSDINNELQTILDNLNEFPELSKPRTLTATIKLLPEHHASLNQTHIHIDTEVKSTLPGKQGRKTIGILRDDKIVVNQDLPEEPNQPSLVSLTT